jgi:hypothetical protein
MMNGTNLVPPILKTTTHGFPNKQLREHAPLLTR